MGMITITLQGSFDTKNGVREFNAQEHGHAHAVNAAIRYLSAEVMHWAISRDHQLHDDDKKPEYGFSRG